VCVKGQVTSGSHAGTCVSCDDVAADQGDTAVTCYCKAPAKGFADLQIAEAYNMQSYIDSKAGGAGLGWYRIVKSPSEARAVIAQGKLAVVLAG